MYHLIKTPNNVGVFLSASILYSVTIASSFKTVIIAMIGTENLVVWFYQIVIMIDKLMRKSME